MKHAAEHRSYGTMEGVAGERLDARVIEITAAAFGSMRLRPRPLAVLRAETRNREELRREGLRRVLVEVAWHYRHPPAIGPTLRARREGQPPEVIAVADRALHSLHRRFTRLITRGKSPHKAVVAVGRELAGFLWITLTTASPPAAQAG